MKQTKITIKIISRQIAASAMAMERLRGELAGRGIDLDAGGEESDDLLELCSEGLLYVDGERVVVEYPETELTGMAGATTRISFTKTDPGLVTMMREGTVETVLIFEQGRTHICAYRTPYMPFELCVRTFRVVNELLERGSLYLDYTVEVQGARLERNKFSMEIEALDETLEALLAHEEMPRVPGVGGEGAAE